MSWISNWFCSCCRSDDSIESQPIKKQHNQEKTKTRRSHVDEAINVKAKRILNRDPHVEDFTDREKQEIERFMGNIEDLQPTYEIAGPTKMHTAKVTDFWNPLKKDK